MVKQFWKLMNCLFMKTDITLLIHIVKLCYAVTCFFNEFSHYYQYVMFPACGV